MRLPIAPARIAQIARRWRNRTSRRSHKARAPTMSKVTAEVKAAVEPQDWSQWMTLQLRAAAR